MATRRQSAKQSPAKDRGFSLQLVPETGVEPATYALRMRTIVILVIYKQ